jgi:hypothetical protein
MAKPLFVQFFGSCRSSAWVLAACRIGKRKRGKWMARVPAPVGAVGEPGELKLVVPAYTGGGGGSFKIS